MMYSYFQYSLVQLLKNFFDYQIFFLHTIVGTNAQ